MASSSCDPRPVPLFRSTNAVNKSDGLVVANVDVSGWISPDLDFDHDVDDDDDDDASADDDDDDDGSRTPLAFWL